MTNYPFVNYKNTKSLIPKEVWLTQNIFRKRSPLFMTEQIVAHDGSVQPNRLRTCDPTHFCEPSI